MSEQVVLEAREIVKSFGKNRVLKEMNFSLWKGEVHALLGINGAGKVRLLKLFLVHISKIQVKLCLKERK